MATPAGIFAGMASNTLLLDVLAGRPVPRAPVWLMRQAGRILPEYRALRASLSGFKELVETPALAAEATLQPIDHLGVDAAIVFSDILTVPEALGLPYEMIPGTGPRFPKTIGTVADIDALRSPEDAAADLAYVYGAVAESRRRLAGRVPLIGFAGAPWTIFCYMIEGKGSKTFSAARKWLRQRPKESERLLSIIAETTALYLQRQIEAGAQAVQLFDSWAGVLDVDLYRRFAQPASLEALRPLADTGVPRIYFAKGIGAHTLATNGMEAYGVDWTTDAARARGAYGAGAVLQGNLDPSVLYAPPEEVHARATAMITAFGPRHIANLGHGVYPDTPLEGVKAFIAAVQSRAYAPAQSAVT